MNHRPSKLITSLSLILFQLWIVSLAAAGEIVIGKQLNAILKEYKRIDFKNKEGAIASLVNLDLQLRQFVKKVSKQQDQEKYWKDDYKMLSLRIGHFSDAFEYEGILLERAHKLNPKSEYRKYTLYSEINADKYCWVEKPKNLVAAFKYLEEFPDGPFVADVYLALGGFHWSLYNYIRYFKDDLTNKPLEELKHEEQHSALLKYIKAISKIPIERQEKQAKTKAIKYIEAYLRTDKVPNDRWKRRLIEIKEGTSTRYGIYSCPD